MSTDKPDICSYCGGEIEPHDNDWYTDDEGDKLYHKGCYGASGEDG